MTRSYRCRRWSLLPALLFLFLSPLLHAQPKPSGGRPVGLANDPILLEVGREKFTVGDVANLYLENPNRGNRTFYDLGRDSAFQFLNILANYRMKVQAALDAGLDKRPEVVAELEKSRLDMIVPSSGNGYLIERKVVDPAVERIFKRRDDEMQLAVIYSAWASETPGDTLGTYKRAHHLLEMALRGSDFLILARDSSDDEKTKKNFGRLPSYITSGMVLPQLEEAVYATKTGEVYPGLVRVPGGYLIVKVLDRSPRYKVRAAHILVSATAVSDTNILNNPFRNKADTALARIRRGEDFAKIAREISDDRTSAENGGDFLVYYTRSLGFEAKNAKLEPAIEEALYRLKDGEVSDIVKTDYGYHIVKRLESRRPTYDEEKETIRQFYKQRLLTEDRARYVKSIEEKHGLRIDDGVMAGLLGVLNRHATTAEGAWASGVDDAMLGRTLYTYGGAAYTVGSWIDTVKARPELRSMALNEESIRSSIYRLHEREAMIDEARNLETEYPEFARLMQETRDGILVGAIEEDVLGKKAAQGYDEARAKVYFEGHRGAYMTQPKLGVTEIFVYTEEEARSLYDEVRKGTVPFDTLAARNTQRPGYRERAGRWETSTAQNTDLVRQVFERKPNPKPGEILKPFQNQEGYSVVRIDTVEPSRRMTYDEAKTLVQGDYFNDFRKQIQKEWLDALRLRYRADINDQALRSLFAAR